MLRTTSYKVKQKLQVCEFLWWLTLATISAVQKI